MFGSAGDDHAAGTGELGEAAGSDREARIGGAGCGPYDIVLEEIGIDNGDDFADMTERRCPTDGEPRGLTHHRRVGLAHLIDTERSGDQTLVDPVRAGGQHQHRGVIGDEHQ